LSLNYLYLGSSGSPGNHFTGQVKLNSPSEVRLNYNWITDVLIADTSQLTSGCDISYNPLLGNPNIVNLLGAPVNCVQVGLYSASLLPNTVTIATTKQGPTTSNFKIGSSLMGTLSFVPFTVAKSISTFSSLTTSKTTLSMNASSAVLSFTNTAKSTSILITSSGSIAPLRSSVSTIDAFHNNRASNALISMQTSYSNMVPITTSEQINKTFFTLTYDHIQILVTSQLTNLNLFKMIFRCFIDDIILTLVLLKTPFMRELKLKLKFKTRATKFESVELL